MNDKIVIDLGAGDSGKGLTAHNLCNSCSLVVRFSGGQQAGHTVIHNGIKHIFSNFGAGTLKGCPTFFTEDTCIYPKTITREWMELKGKGVDPKLYIHPLAKVTTPYDVWSGRQREKKHRHGSCGLGVGATMKRNEGPVKLYAVDLLAPKSFLKAKLQTIDDYYDIDEEEFTDADWLMFQKDIQAFNESIEDRKFDICRFDQLPFLYSNIIFEGSQGVLLDMDHGVFPHVTFANTTSKNAWKYARPETEVYHLTRCYKTRHGNGPFEGESIELINNHEEINKLNEWQGEFKTAELDYELLKYAANVDASYHPTGTKVNLVISCLDQRPDFKFNMKFAGNFYDGFFQNNSAESGHLQEKFY